MTLLTAVVTEEHVLLATDTVTFSSFSGRPGYTTSKVAPLVHLRAALSTQGASGLQHFLTSKTSHIESFDAAEAMMPRLLDVASRTLPGIAPDGHNKGCRVALAGYSDARGRMVVLLWTSEDGLLSVRRDVLTAGMMLVPSAAAPRARIGTLEDFQQYLVEQQMPYLRARGTKVGGELVLLQIGQHDLQIKYGPPIGLTTPADARATAESAQHIYDPDTSFNTLTVSPNTSLPDPTIVEQVTGVTVDSGPTDQTDMSVIVRTVVSWDPVVGQAVRQSGRIEVQWMEASAALPAGDWPGRAEVEGNSTSVVIPGLLAGVHYLFRVRARNTLGVRGMWSNHKLGQVAAAPTVTVALSDTSASGQINSNSPDFFVVVRSTVCQIAWTNDVSEASVVVQYESSAFGAWSNSGGGAGTIWFETDYSVSGGGGAAGVASQVVSGAGEFQATNIGEALVPAGSTVTVTLRAAAMIAAGTQVRNTWRDALLRVTAIVR